MKFQARRKILPDTAVSLRSVINSRAGRTNVGGTLCSNPSFPTPTHPLKKRGISAQEVQKKPQSNSRSHSIFMPKTHRKNRHTDNVQLCFWSERAGDKGILGNLGKY